MPSLGTVLTDTLQETQVVQEDPEDEKPADPVTGLAAVPDHPAVQQAGGQHALQDAKIHAPTHALHGVLLGSVSDWIYCVLIFMCVCVGMWVCMYDGWYVNMLKCVCRIGGVVGGGFVWIDMCVDFRLCWCVGVHDGCWCVNMLACVCQGVA